jgi:hypothetical protein
MGLTVHFKLAAPASCTGAEAKRLVGAMRRLALRFQRNGLVDRVHPIRSDADTLRRFGRDWLIVPVPGQQNTSTGIEVPPLEGFLFRVEVGQDCEPLRLGLCRYPQTVVHRGDQLRTRLGTGWRWAGFSKTQYASLHGWGHFHRCHCAVVELLAACRSVGVRVRISDEGDYWPRRSFTALRRNLNEMNGLVAATAGALKDVGDTARGSSRVESPIFAHRRFERLEAEGAARVAPVLERVRAAMGDA